MSTPFSKAALSKPTEVPKKPEELHPASETDIYRTFTPSDVAFWDFGNKNKTPGAQGTSSGLFSKIGSLFGTGGGTTSK